MFVDSGSVLFQRKKIPPKKEAEEKTKADGIAAALQAMNCRAVGIGVHDLAGGIGVLKELEERYKTVWLSMNLVDPDRKKPIFTPYLITQVGGLKVALLGLTDDQGEHHNKEKEAGYTILPWQNTLPRTLAKIKKQADITILLSSYSYQMNKKIAETVSDLHIILESGHAASTTEPYTVKKTLIAQTGTRGKFLGMMRITWNKARQWNSTSSSSKSAKSGCTYTNQFIALKTSLPEDSKVKKIIDRTIQKANDINKKRVHLAGQDKPTTTLQDVAGSGKCQQCHATQMAAWQNSKHAKAWDTLEKKNQHFNGDCLICHVTLPYYDTDKVKAANLLLLLPQSLKEVGCEACHGPAAAHSTGRGKAPVARPDEKVCLVCHTPEHDDHFVFSEKVKRLGCSAKQKAGTE